MRYYDGLLVLWCASLACRIDSVPSAAALSACDCGILERQWNISWRSIRGSAALSPSHPASLSRSARCRFRLRPARLRRRKRRFQKMLRSRSSHTVCGVRIRALVKFGCPRASRLIGGRIIRTLGLYRRMGLVLGVRRRRGQLGLGRLSLRPLGIRARLRLVLGAGRRMGARLGELALRRRVCRLGAASAR